MKKATSPRHAARLRERPPVWPRRDEGGDEPPRRRRTREREVFEDDAVLELYPASVIMEDLVAGPDTAASLRILARYTVARLLVLCAAGLLTGPKLRTERRIAQEHLVLLAETDWERRALERVTELCRETLGPAVIEPLLVAAESAAKRSHTMGAFGLYRAGYELAKGRGWWVECEAAARGIGRLAALHEARYSTRLWERRARVMARRAARAAGAAGSQDMAE